MGEVATASHQQRLLTSVKQLRRVWREKRLHLLGSPLILLRLSASGSHGYTVNHRQREKKHFYRVLTWTERERHNYTGEAGPGDLWMNPSLRGSKGDGAAAAAATGNLFYS